MFNKVQQIFIDTKKFQPNCTVNRYNNMKLDVGIMKVKKIEQVNEAVFILRHFINLSAKLLPFLHELTKNENPSEKELNDLNKIISVYINYTFDTKTSKHLMDSNILENIRAAFRTIIQRSENAPNELERFLNEHDRLRKKWKHIDAN